MRRSSGTSTLTAALVPAALRLQVEAFGLLNAGAADKRVVLRCLDRAGKPLGLSALAVGSGPP
jgi:hypothetical protein